MIAKNDLYRAIGEQIRVNRLANSLNQEKLASFVGLTRSSIAQIEAGKQAPSIFLLYQICNILKISIADVLPKEEFEPLSADRFSDKTRVIGILEKVKANGGEYEPSEHTDESK
jgi:transcriptional regulator with XRE-family HTH domain